MSNLVHRFYILTMVLVVVLSTVYLSYTGFEFYNLPIEERFYHEHYDWFEPGGDLGHGLGIVGTLMILFGVVIYIARKRYNFLERWIRLKYLLEFHIFLCTLGPILIVFHTSFKFGGIVSIAFWSMLAVVLSGVIGRYIYIQIPRTIEGRELSLQEVQNIQSDLSEGIQKENIFSESQLNLIKNAGNLSSLSIGDYFKKLCLLSKIKRGISQVELSKPEKQNLYSNIKREISLSQRISRLNQMQQLFKYWHVAHLPFALIMLIIVLIHVIVTVALGYKWIF